MTPWISAKEAAQYLGRNSKFAYKGLLRLAREGKVKAGHDGKTFKFKVEDLDAYLYLEGKRRAA